MSLHSMKIMTNICAGPVSIDDLVNLRYKLNALLYRLENKEREPTFTIYSSLRKEGEYTDDEKALLENLEYEETELCHRKPIPIGDREEAYFFAEETKKLLKFKGNWKGYITLMKEDQTEAAIFFSLQPNKKHDEIADLYYEIELSTVGKSEHEDKILKLLKKEINLEISKE